MDEMSPNSLLFVVRGCKVGISFCRSRMQHVQPSLILDRGLGAVVSDMSLN